MATIDRPAPQTFELAAQTIDTAKDRKQKRHARRIAHRSGRPDAEAHRLRGIARLKAAVGNGPTKVLRIPITNTLDGSDYSARLVIGTKGQTADVILDTGSSTLAVDPKAYSGAGDGALKPTTLLQLVTYGTGGWAGPVIDTTLTFDGLALPGAPIAITDVQQKGNFQGVTGIMGLAYNGLNDAWDFQAYLAQHGKASTYPWPFGKAWTTFAKGFGSLVKTAKAPDTPLKPYFDQLEMGGVVANKFAFYTLRSWLSVRRGVKPAEYTADPLNSGWFILGGGEEQTDLYSGAFVDVKVLHDLYYNTNLKSVRVDGCPAHAAAALQPQYYQYAITNSIVDSGTSDLSLAQDVYDAILAGLKQVNPAFAQAAVNGQNLRAGGVATSSLDFAKWPNIHFVLEGANGADVDLVCTPQTYWQTDFPAAGRAVFQISGPLSSPGEVPPNQSILGLPLMNNYYCVFDRTKDVYGVIRFAKIKPPA